ncbi:hypothetical protein [Flexithrix dorotheae]|uniref:hypothetical protein n=1 Tax=Flexithrix dorotheae TaxID=70993 RepID=UPI000377F4D0|nr:hypothetical protein [Flexithrix dorotheae]
MEDKKICLIDISSDDLLDVFTFYESGKIKHFFDKTRFNHSLTKWYADASKIPEIKIDQLIKKCPKEYFDKIKLILYQY